MTMILSQDKAETLGERIVDLVKAIIKGMGIGIDHARDVGDTNVAVRVVRIDRMTFHATEAGRGATTITGIHTAAQFIAHLLLTAAWMKNDVPNLMTNLEAAAKTIVMDDEAAAIGKAVAPSNDDNGTKTLEQSDREHLMRKLRRVEKAMADGTISRRTIAEAVEGLEDRIENRYSSDDYDRLMGAVEMLANLFKV